VKSANGVCQTEVVPEFCTCGVQLPPDARFCHKCGKPQYDYPALEETEQTPQPPEPLNQPTVGPIQLSAEISFHNSLAVRIGFIAALGAVLISLFPVPWPWVRLPVAFVAAGFLAVYLYSRRTGQVLSMRSAARMGWITGIFSFTLVSVLFAIAMVAITTQGGFEKELRSQFPPNDARAEMIQQVLSNPALIAAGLALYLMLFFIILTALPMLGGMLGAKVLVKE
jgi:uncharacterized membrane protein